MFFFANYILLQCDIQPFAEYAVAPHVGAWIETCKVPPVLGYRARVAPHVGAWIETRAICKFALLVDVAPHVGAWIETSNGGGQ